MKGLAPIAGRLDIRDASVFEDVYRRIRPLLRLMTKRYRIPASESEEMIQDVFLRLFECEGLFANQASVRAFLVKSLRHRIIDRFRRDRSHPVESLFDAASLGEPWTGNDDSFTPLQYESALLALQQVILRIGKETGEDVFTLFYSQGMSVRRISEQTGEPIGSITAKLCRLRRRYGETMRTHVTRTAGL